MKLKIYDRLVLFFGALLTIVAGTALAVTGLQIAGTIGESLSLGLRIACIGVGALTVIFGFYLLAFPQKLKADRQGFVVQRTDNGELRISIKAIEGLVQKCIDMHDEIDVVSQRIRNTRDGVTVDLNIALANNISIPLAVAALQKQIKQYLSASSGIEITEVRVTVDTAQMPAPETEAQSADEAQPAEEAPAPAEAEKPAPKAKLPLHQRIFGRSETAANMPEPPAPEEAPAVEEAPAAEEAAAEEAAPQAEAAEEIAEEIAEEPAEETIEEPQEETVEETAEMTEEAAEDTEETRNE